MSRGGSLCSHVETGLSSDACDDCDVFEVWMGVEIQQHISEVRGEDVRM